jgi:thiamine pyrophosphokinase
MAKCIIFCAARFDKLISPAEPDDYIIAADGGVRHTRALGLKPDCVLGDFDSLGYIPQGAQVFPTEKDDTDAMLAVRRGLAAGYTEFYIYGGLDGPRLDHTVANFQTLQYLADHGARGYLVGEEYMATVIRNGALALPARQSGYVSVFCMGADAEGVNIRGLKYTVEDGILSAGFPLGVSNQFTGEPAHISVKHGSLLILYGR